MFRERLVAFCILAGAAFSFVAMSDARAQEVIDLDEEAKKAPKKAPAKAPAKGAAPAKGEDDKKGEAKKGEVATDAKGEEAKKGEAKKGEKGKGGVDID